MPTIGCSSSGFYILNIVFLVNNYSGFCLTPLKARRAFRTLKGIIRLQAVIRGHLVRRQAIATLYCVRGIVKFQALVRGYKVRRSDVGCAVQKMCKVKFLTNLMINAIIYGLSSLKFS